MGRKELLSAGICVSVCAVLLFLRQSKLLVGLAVLAAVFAVVDAALSSVPMKQSTLKLIVKGFVMLQAVLLWVFWGKMDLTSSTAAGPFMRSISLRHEPVLATDTTATTTTTDPLVPSQHPHQLPFHRQHEHHLLHDVRRKELAEDTADPTPASAFDVFAHMDAGTLASMTRVFGDRSNFPPPVTFPDLKYRSPAEVRSSLSQIFSELPEDGFLTNFRNPCWHRADRQDELACLPYAYVLGQPKCGSSDLFERLRRHPDVAPPDRKEIRWFTRGEFSDRPLPPERHGPITREPRLSNESSVYSFTHRFADATKVIQANPRDVITLDGGPHTFWWPTQQPDGSLVPEDIPPPQIIREMQPAAKFIITLTDPVRRTFSDYHFLNDDKTVARGSSSDRKSSQQFHERSMYAITKFKECVDAESYELSKAGFKDEGLGGVWFRASQICAHDRHTYGLAGWGRLSIGLYSLYMEKWLEHFSQDQFLVTRLEDFDSDPKAYLIRIYHFLDLRIPAEHEWETILRGNHYNEHISEREPMLAETDALLRDFYQPYNNILAQILQNEKFTFSDHKQFANVTERHNYIQALAKAIDIDKQKHAIENAEEESDEEPVTAPLSFDEAIKKQIRDREKLMKSLTHEERNLIPFHNNAISSKHKESNASNSYLFTPADFDIADLPQGRSEFMMSWLERYINLGKPPNTLLEAGKALALAVFSLDIPAVRYLLKVVGVPANTPFQEDMQRPAIIALSSLGTMAEAHVKSQIFNLLKGKHSWLTDIFDPPLPVLQHSVHALDILESLQGAIHNVTLWLIRAGADLTVLDGRMCNALDYASYGGLYGLVKDLLENAKFDINAQRRKDKRTPLHWALAMGRVDIARELVKHGADLHLPDAWNVTGYDIIFNPGTITPNAAYESFGISQRPPRKIERMNHPERATTVQDPSTNPAATQKDWHEYWRSWPAGTGGWGEERLPGYEDDMHCNIDQYWADEITSEEVFYKYMARNTPVMIRGLLHKWKAAEQYRLHTLNATFGHIKIEASDIPYSHKFGGNGSLQMPLSEYIAEVQAHKMVGGNHPWYVFKGNPIPKGADGANSFVPYEICPTPPILEEAFSLAATTTLKDEILDKSQMKDLNDHHQAKKHNRHLFVNAQWALGGEGTGAPIHYHNTAWSALVYGAKKWVIYPPHDQVMSNRQILQYLETDAIEFMNRPMGKAFAPTTCIQTAGDVIIIPESWGHGVLNIQESIAIATEARQGIWRLIAGYNLVQLLPVEEK